jgi:putative flippase GtrA
VDLTAGKDTTGVYGGHGGATTITGRGALLRRLVRFLAAGGLSAAVDVGLLALLHGAFQVPLIAATSIAFWTSLAVNFALNRRWVFAGSGPGLHRQLGRYLVAVGINYVTTLALVAGLTAVGIGYLVAKLAAMAVTACWNYLLYRFWIFT